MPRRSVRAAGGALRDAREHRVEPLAVEPRAGPAHAAHGADGRDVFERVGGQQHGVGDAAGPKTAPGGLAEKSRDVRRGRRQRRCRAQPGFDVELELAVQAVSGHVHDLRRIGAGEHDGAGRIEFVDQRTTRLDEGPSLVLGEFAAHARDGFGPLALRAGVDEPHGRIGQQRIDVGRREVLDERLRGDVGDAGFARALGNPRDPLGVDGFGDRDAEESRRPLAGRVVGRNQRLGIAVEVVDGGLAGGQRAVEPDADRDVAGVADADAVGGRIDGAEGVGAQARVQLQEVVAGLGLAKHRGAGLGSRGHGVAVQRRPRGHEPRARALAAREVGAQGDVAGLAEHAADRGHAVGQEQRQHVVDALGRFVRRDVGVHLGQARHEEGAAGVDAEVGRLDAVDDPAVDDGHARGVGDARGVGIDDADVVDDEAGRGRGGRGQRGQQQRGGCEVAERVHRRSPGRRDERTAMLSGPRGQRRAPGWNVSWRLISRASSGMSGPAAETSAMLPRSRLTTQDSMSRVSSKRIGAPATRVRGM